LEEADRSERYEVERSRAYADRLVLKLGGVDDATGAARLRGRGVKVLEQEAPELPPGEHYSASLVGMEVRDESGRELGRVRDVVPTGGADLLVVEATGTTAGELLIPMAEEIVEQIDREGCLIRVRLPDGLEELNRE
jgi:16S rRNA processing protein RimM